MRLWSYLPVGKFAQFDKLDSTRIPHWKCGGTQQSSLDTRMVSVEMVFSAFGTTYSPDDETEDEAYDLIVYREHAEWSEVADIAAVIRWYHRAEQKGRKSDIHDDLGEAFASGWGKESLLRQYKAARYGEEDLEAWFEACGVAIGREDR